jgi:hypothetical protein
MKNSQSFFTLAGVKNTALKLCIRVAFFFTLLGFTTSVSAQHNDCCKPLNIKGEKTICRYEQSSGVVSYTVSGFPAGCGSPYYIWSTTPGGITFSGQGTATISINIASIPAGTTSFTINVGTFCGNQCYLGTFTVNVSPILNASFNMTLSTSGTGMSLSATAISGVGLHYWLLFRVDCTTQAYIATSGLPVSGSASTFTYPSLVAGNCYVLYHWNYVNGCYTYKRRFFTITPAAKMAAQSVEDNVPLPAQLQSNLPFLNEQRRD